MLRLARPNYKQLLAGRPVLAGEYLVAGSGSAPDRWPSDAVAGEFMAGRPANGLEIGPWAGQEAAGGGWPRAKRRRGREGEEFAEDRELQVARGEIRQPLRTFLSPPAADCNISPTGSRPTSGPTHSGQTLEPGP